MKIWLLAVMIIFMGCSANKAQKRDIDESPQSSVTKKVDVPAWVSITPQNTNQFKYAVGTGLSQSGADLDAKREISAYFESYIKSQYGEYWNDTEIDGKELFQDYIEQTIISYTDMTIPGIQIIERAQRDNTFYTLTGLDMRELEAYQNRLNNSLKSYLKGAETEASPTLKIDKYLMGLALSVKAVEPLKYNGKPAVLYINDEINRIVKDITLEKHIGMNEITGEIQSINVYPVYKGNKVQDYPFQLKDIDYTKDESGTYIISYNKSMGLSLSLSFELNVNDIILPDEIKSYEKGKALNLIHIVAKATKAIQITLPRIPKVFIQTSVLSDNTLDDLMLRNSVKSILTGNQVLLTEQRTEANTVILITANVSYSSHTALGHCYKTTGTISIKQDGSENIVINISGMAVEEETKAFGNTKQKAALKSLQSFSRLASSQLEKSIPQLEGSE